MLRCMDVQVLQGHGQGTRMGVPTINLDPSAVPDRVEHGVYACRIGWDNTVYDGALHYGPRPVFDDEVVSCEVHVLDEVIEKAPTHVDLEIYEKIRDIQHFPSKEELVEEIERDIQSIRAILRSP